MTMGREDFDNKLDSLIENAIGKETSFDFDKWKQQHQGEISKYKAKTAGDSGRRPRRMLIRFAAAAGAIAAMIAVAVILTIPDKATDEPTEVAQYKPLPANVATIGRLNMAFRSGGLDAIENFCERTVRTNGPRPERMTAQQLLKEMESETGSKKGNENENHSNNSTFNHRTST
jgi:hypothetical protein